MNAVTEMTQIVNVKQGIRYSVGAVLHILLWWALTSVWTVVESPGEIQHAFLSVFATVTCETPQKDVTKFCSTQYLWKLGTSGIYLQLVAVSSLLASFCNWFIFAPSLALDRPSVRFRRLVLFLLLSIYSSVSLALMGMMSWNRHVDSWISQNSGKLGGCATTHTWYFIMSMALAGLSLPIVPILFDYRPTARADPWVARPIPQDDPAPPAIILDPVEKVPEA